MTDERIATDFRDKDPEDVWDDNDSFLDRLRILERVVESVRDDIERRAARIRNALRLVAKLEMNRREARVHRERLRRVREQLEGMD